MLSALDADRFQRAQCAPWDTVRVGCSGVMLCSLAGVNFNIDQCSPNGTDPYKPKCPETNEDNKKPIFPEWLTVILLCLYLLFTNILLLNLLIAMFK